MSNGVMISQAKKMAVSSEIMVVQDLLSSLLIVLKDPTLWSLLGTDSLHLCDFLKPFNTMHITCHVIFFVLSALISASPTPNDQSPRSEIGALVSYGIGCNAGGNTLPRCYEGGSAGCRCDYIGTVLCQDAECRDFCGCQPCVTSPRLLTYYDLRHNCIQHPQPRRLLPELRLSTLRMMIST